MWTCNQLRLTNSRISMVCAQKAIQPVLRKLYNKTRLIKRNRGSGHVPSWTANSRIPTGYAKTAIQPVRRKIFNITRLIYENSVCGHATSRDLQTLESQRFMPKNLPDTGEHVTG